MVRSNADFSLLSLNARGIRTFEKQKAIFSWRLNSGADICFLQESYSTQEVENIWRKQWKGIKTCSFRTVRDNFDFQLVRSIKVYSQGRYVFLEVSIQDSPYFLLNIYAPNKCSEQCTFFKEISEILKAARTEQNYPIIVRGHFNVIPDPDLDGRVGNNKKKDSARLVEDMHLDFDLVDIWRIRNPTASRFTWCQKTPVV